MLRKKPITNEVQPTKPQCKWRNKDRQFADKIKAKADEMYIKSQGVKGQFYGDREDAMVIYDYLSDFYHEITGEYL